MEPGLVGREHPVVGLEPVEDRGQAAMEPGLVGREHARVAGPEGGGEHAAMEPGLVGREHGTT